MKKLFILSTCIIALCSAAIAGCGVKNSEETFEPQTARTRIAVEEDNDGETVPEEKDENGEAPDGEHCKDHCRKKMPRVIFKHGHGNGAGNGVQFFAIRFGDDGNGRHGHHKHDRDHDGEPAPEQPEETQN